MTLPPKISISSTCSSLGVRSFDERSGTLIHFATPESKFGWICGLRPYRGRSVTPKFCRFRSSSSTCRQDRDPSSRAPASQSYFHLDVTDRSVDLFQPCLRHKATYPNRQLVGSASATPAILKLNRLGPLCMRLLAPESWPWRPGPGCGLWHCHASDCLRIFGNR